MKKKLQKYSPAFFSLVSTARSMQGALFTAFISYAFIKNSNQHQLMLVNQTLILLNLLSIFTGWGLKGYLQREQIANSGEFKKTWSNAMLAKLLLNLIACGACITICSPNNFIIVFALITIRTLNSHFEPLLLLSNKNLLALSFESLFYVSLFFLVYTKSVDTSVYFLFLLMLSELCKTVLLFLVFKGYLVMPDIKRATHMLWETRFFFIAALGGFFQNKIDLYALSVLLKNTSLNQYQIITGIMSFAYVCITSFTAMYSKLFYKNLKNSKSKFWNINLYTGLFVGGISTLMLFFLMPVFYDYNFSFMQATLFFINVVTFSVFLVEMYYYTEFNKISISTLLIFLGGSLNLLLSFFLVKKFTITGALMSNTTAQIILLMVTSFIRQRLSKQTLPKHDN